jgi:hypothetical protein
MIVGYEDAQQGHAHSFPPGRRATTRVPPSAGDSTENFPPSSSARSCIEESPTPRWRSSDGPTPSGNLQSQFDPLGPILEREGDAAVARPGVTRRVGDSFPRDVVGGDLYCRGQWRQLLGCIDHDAHPVFVLRRALLRVVVDRRHEAELVEGRRSVCAVPAFGSFALPTGFRGTSIPRGYCGTGGRRTRKGPEPLAREEPRPH